MDKKQTIGSQTAKSGFKNEHFVVHQFNNWQNSALGRGWLQAMGYNLDDIESVQGYKITGSYKSDVQVQINLVIKLKSITDIQNIQVKLVSNPRGFNQIDKRWVDKYQALWDMPDDIVTILKQFTGELPPTIPNPRDLRRTFADELSADEQKALLQFLTDNKTLIVSDILRGRGSFCAEWMLVILITKGNDVQWVLKPMNFVLNYFGNGAVKITARGSIKIGRITLQRKGGDGGRATANMLQFKINPSELFSV